MVTLIVSSLLALDPGRPVVLKHGDEVLVSRVIDGDTIQVDADAHSFVFEKAPD